MLVRATVLLSTFALVAALPQQQSQEIPFLRLLGSVNTVTSYFTTTSTFTQNVLPTCILYANNLPPCPQLQKRSLEGYVPIQPSDVQSIETTSAPIQERRKNSIPDITMRKVREATAELQTSQSDEYRIYGLPSEFFSGQERQFFNPLKPSPMSIIRVVSSTISSLTTVTKTMPVIRNQLVRLTVSGCLPVNPPLAFPQCPAAVA